MHIPLGIIVTDRHGRIIYMSDTMREMWCSKFRNPVETCTDHTATTIYHMDGRPYDYEEWPLIRALRTKECVKNELLKLKDDDDSWIYAQVTALPILDAQNELEYVILFCENVSDRYRVEEEASKSNIASQFLARMSHEIRTPIHGILGMLDLIHETTLNVEQTNYIQVIMRSTKNLLVILNDILDFSKAKSQKLEFINTNYNIRQLFNDVEVMFTSVTKGTNVKLTVTIEDNIPETNYGDIQRFMQCLVNVVSNAVKFVNDVTDTKVDITVSSTNTRSAIPARIKQLKTRKRLLVKISDTGIGMTEEQQSRLFKPFVQADSTIHRRFGGTGLGLATVKEILDQMGGTISVTSKTGEGSTFTLSIPLVTTVDTTTSDSESSGSPRSPISLGAKLLLAEDNPVNKDIMVAQLVRYGYFVSAVEDGTEVLKLIDKDPSYDLILMDIQMPKLGGYQTCQTLRERKWNKPIIALTASAMEHDRLKCLEIGMNDFVSKPFNIKKLILKIEEHLEHSRQTIHATRKRPAEDSNLEQPQSLTKKAYSS
jgi:signal transduction histidine kinase/CheY-like chemotaxis protein